MMGLPNGIYYITSVSVEDSNITITYLKYNKEYTLTENLDNIVFDFGVKEKYSVSGFDVLRKTSKYDTKRIFRQGYILDWNKDENIEALKTMALNIKNREK